MTDQPGFVMPPCSLLRDCSDMDHSVVARLRATVQLSVTWAEQTLDALIHLDNDLEVLEAMVKQQVTAPLQHVWSASCTPQTDSHVQRLRHCVREMMMSMQHQDVIGQAIERAAGALEKRAATVVKAMVTQDSHPPYTLEVIQIHRAYQTEDDMHRAANWNMESREAA